MNTILYIFVFVTICTASKETDEIDDEKLPVVLTVLGDKLVKELISPKYNNGTDLMEDLFDYYNNLDDIQELLDNGDNVRVERGRELYKIMVDAGGPQILKIQIDYDKLIDQYRWERDGKEINYARQVVKDITDLWKTIVEKAERVIVITQTTTE